VKLRPIAGKELIEKVWGKGGNFKKVTFVKAHVLLDHLAEIFPDINVDILEDVRVKIKSEMARLH